jgi:hypothetical protein
MRLAWSFALAAAAALAGWAGAGCTKANPQYCDDTVQCPGGAACDMTTNTCGDPLDAAMPDANIQCTMDEQCTGVCEMNMCVDCVLGDCAVRTDGKNVCDTTLGDCVQCVDSDDCTDLAMPICQDGMCRTCAGDAECETLSGSAGEIGICTMAGACIGEGDTIFVDASADCAVADGTAQMPYCVIQDAVDDAGAGKNVILVRAGNYAPAVIQDLMLVLQGRGNPSVRLGAANVSRLEVSGALADVIIRGFELSGATTDPAAGLFCRNNSTCRLERSTVGLNAFGVYAQNADLTVERTTIHENASGGLLTTATDFTVTNSWFWGNGGSNIGAAQLGTNGPTARREFRNNTLFSNFVGIVPASVGAVQCQVATALTSNIYRGNDTPMIGVMCTVDHSFIDDAIIGGMATNSTMDPQFVDENPVNPDLHIMAGSPAIGAALATGAPALDFDGQSRDDGAPDVGSDEVP